MSGDDSQSEEEEISRWPLKKDFSKNRAIRSRALPGEGWLWQTYWLQEGSWGGSTELERKAYWAVRMGS